MHIMAYACTHVKRMNFEFIYILHAFCKKQATSHSSFIYTNYINNRLITIAFEVYYNFKEMPYLK